MLELVYKHYGVEQKYFILLFLHPVKGHLKVIAKTADATNACPVDVSHTTHLLPL